LRQRVIDRVLRRTALCTVALLLSWHPEPARAETGAEPQRPRVGLVLSGGGARGFAHVGVLEVLEELHVEVDFVAGTSMGAVVGGLYASGMSPAELRQVIEGIDWINAFTDTPPRRNRSFLRKRDDFDFLTRLRLYVKNWRIALPKGFVEGQKITNILAGLTVPVATIDDFDALSIPFRAIATDASTGAAVILDSGSLALAMRASMAVPAIFSPVEMHGRTLVDGGVANNLPIDVIREMGADVIIAVDIATKPGGAADVGSGIGIAGQMLTVLMYENTLEQLENLGERDVLIQPDLPGISSMSFEKGREGVEFGVEAARAMAEELSRLAVPAARFAEFRERRDAVPRTPPVIDTVRFDNQSKLGTKVIQHKIEVPTGEPLDVARLEHQLGVLYGEGIFDSVTFSLEEVEGRNELVIHTLPKEQGSHFLRFGLNLETNFTSESDFNLAMLATSTPMNKLGAEWRNRFQVGQESEFKTEFFQPLESGRRLFVAPEFRIGIESADLFADGDRIATYERPSIEAAGFLGWQFGNWGEVRAGLGYLAGEFDLRVGDPNLPSFKFNGGGAVGRITIDTLDSVRFPRKGGLLRVRANYLDDSLGAEESSATSDIRGTLALSYGENTLTTNVLLATSWRNDTDIARLPVHRLGGLFRLSGLTPGEIAGPNTLYGSLIAYRRVANPRFFTLNLPVYVGGSVETGNAYAAIEEIDAASLIVAGSIFLGLDTPLGPLYVAYGLAEGRRSSGYLFLGQRF